MLKPVKCPKCRNINHVCSDGFGGFYTMITCSHFSETIDQFKIEMKIQRENIERLKELGEEDPFKVCGLPLDPRESDIPDVPFNCRCSSAEIRVTLMGKGLGYSEVPHFKTSGVKNFLYGFK